MDTNIENYIGSTNQIRYVMYKRRHKIARQLIRILCFFMKSFFFDQYMMA